MRGVGGVAAAVLVAALLPRAHAAPPAPARLVPQALTVEMEAGGSRALEYGVELPAQPPPPTDLYLLVDVGERSRPYLDVVRSRLHDVLGSLPRGVMIGVGEFRTSSAADWHDGLTYRALRRVGPVDAALVRAVDRLGREQPTLPQAVPGPGAHAVALEQAVTGDGHWPSVPPGQDAGFRPGARQVVVVVTPAAFGADPTQPSRSDAVAALRAAGVEVFGLALDTAALSDLTAVAAGTGAVTDRTVDCGAGRRIAAGRPAACVVSSGAIGGALAGMLYEQRRGTLTFAATGSGVRRLTPRAVSVDLNAPSRVRLRLDIGCGANDGGRTHRITLTAALSGKAVARASVVVRCRHR